MTSSLAVSSVISGSRLLTQPPQSRYLLYSKGSTAIFACEADPRASFCLYIPSTHPVERLYKGESIEGCKSTFPLVVLIHHAGLNGQSLRDDWSEWAENHQCVVLSPMFPYSFRGVSGKTSSLHFGLDADANVAKNDEFADYYKYMKDPDPSNPVRYDLLLLDMVETTSSEWGFIDTDRFCLAGYSAGGQVSPQSLPFLIRDTSSVSTVGLLSLLVSPSRTHSSHRHWCPRNTDSDRL
jgi:poly(3-hydroxybutyrate) depolymerase